MKIKEFLEAKKNVEEKEDRYVYNCSCLNKTEKKRKEKGVLYKNNLKKEYCSHKPNQGISTNIEEDNLYSEFQQRKENYYLQHGLNTKELIKLGLIDSHLNVIIKNTGKKKILVDSTKKLKFSSKNIFKKDVGDLYPVFGTGKKLYIFAGEFDYFKAALDTLVCTTPVHGEATNLNSEKTFEKLEKFEEIVFVYDADETGKKARNKAILDLKKRLQDQKIGYIDLPFKDSENGKDYCDWRQTHTINKFLKLEVKWLESIHSKTNKNKPNQKEITTKEVEETLEVPEEIKDIELNLSKLHPTFTNYWSRFEGNTEAPKEFVIPSFLTGIGGSIGNRTILKIGNGIRPNLYLLLLGASTYAKKSTSQNIGLKELREINKGIKKEYLANLKEWENLEEKKLKNKPKDLSIFYPNDVTPEQLLVKMQDRPDGLFCFGELGRLLARMKSSYSVGFKETLTEMFDFPVGEIFTKETKTQGNVCISDPCPSLLGASTFQWMQTHLANADLLSGFLARFCYVVKHGYPENLIPRPPFFKTSKKYQKLFRYLNQIKMMELELSDEAGHLYDEWYTKYTKTSQNEDVLLHSCLARLADVCHKIAIINHVLDIFNNNHTQNAVIQVHSYEQALPWIEFFAANIKLCYRELTQGVDLNETKILEIIRTKGKKIENGKKQLPRHETFRYAHLKKKDGEELIDTLKIKNLLMVVTKRKYTYYQVLDK